MGLIVAYCSIWDGKAKGSLFWDDGDSIGMCSVFVDTNANTFFIYSFNIKVYNNE